MRLLLTSAGIKNTSIHEALVDLLGKPIPESSALCIPTATHALGDPNRHGSSSADKSPEHPCASWVGSRWGCSSSPRCPASIESSGSPVVQEADVLLVNGGDPLYLCYWMRQSGLADLLPSLRETVWVGLSAGSIVMSPHIGEDFVGWKPPTGDDSTLGIVDFSIFPHLDHEDLPENTMADAERWAAGIPGPAYAIDDETAIRVVDGTVEVVSEGHWKLFAP